MTDWIPTDEWQTVVRHLPIASVDLVVAHDDGVVLGRRTNEPAKGRWFMPGGRLRKGERLLEAVTRVGKEELGVDVDVRRRLGVHDHVWETHDVPGVATKQYVSHGFLVEPTADPVTGGPGDSQHDEIRVFRSRPQELHEYVATYLDEAGVL